MNAKSSSALLAILLGILFSPVSFAQNAHSQRVPNESVCDALKGQTPGLYGMCVAFCEAQDCNATYDSSKNTLTYDAQCRPSSQVILQKFNSLAGPDGPAMPCVKDAQTSDTQPNVTQTQCPCWTQQELGAIGDGGTTTCSSTAISGKDATYAWNYDIAEVSPATSGYGPTCYYQENNPYTIRFLQITDDEFISCQQSLETECQLRGY